MEKRRKHRRSEPAGGMTAVSGRINEAWHRLRRIFLFSRTSRGIYTNIDVPVLLGKFIRSLFDAKETNAVDEEARATGERAGHPRIDRKKKKKKHSKSSWLVSRRLYERLAVGVR